MIRETIRKHYRALCDFPTGQYRVGCLLGFTLLVQTLHIALWTFPKRDALTYLHILHYWNTTDSFQMVMEKFPKFGLLLFSFLPLKWADRLGIPLFPASIVWMVLMSLVSVWAFYRIVFLLTGNAGKATWCAALMAIHPAILEAGGNLLRDTPYLMFCLLHALCILEVLKSRRSILMTLSGVTLAMSLLSRFEAWELLLISPCVALFYARKRDFRRSEVICWAFFGVVGFLFTTLLMLAAVDDLASLYEKGKFMLLSFFPDWMKLQ